MPEVASQTFDLVGREVNATLGEARAALEAYVEQPDNVQLLEHVRARPAPGAGRAARCSRSTAPRCSPRRWSRSPSYLIATHSERKNQAESLDALMRAMVQLPGYLERVLAGGRDLALVLLPLLNDLRAVRGSSLLSEGTLLLLNLKSDQQAQPTAPAPGRAAADGRAVGAAPARALPGRASSAGSAASVPSRTSRSSPTSPRNSSRSPRASRCSSCGG